MRREEQILADIVAAADAIGRSLRGRSHETFLSDDDARDATLYRLVVIGEAVSRWPASVRTLHPEIPWRSMTGFRNRAVHASFAVDWTIVWETAAHAVPILHDQIAAIPTREEAPPDSPGR